MSKNNVLTRARKKQAEALFRENRLLEAKELYARICQVDKRDAESWFMLGVVNVQLGLPDEVVECCQRATDIKSDYLEAHLCLGNAFLCKGRFDEAASSFRHALKIRPGSAEAHSNLGNALAAMNRLAEAEASYRCAINAMPHSAEVYNNLGGILLKQGRVDAAIASYRQALMLSQNRIVGLQDIIPFKAYSNMSYAMNYSARITPEELFREHRRWADVFGRLFAAPPTHANLPDPERVLRIGYVSPDFREHSVAYFIEPLLAHHDSTAFQAFCYADVASPDATTQRLRQTASQWRNIYGMDDVRVADVIRADAIDILVDLAGHTAGNRLRVFALKPAPVQVTYLGYPGTTGVPAMDYRLTDAWADPPGMSERFHTEVLVRLPSGFLCYQPPADAPPADSLPCSATGHVTFGSFNNLAKVSPQVISLWASILKAVPGSRLVLKNQSLSDVAVRERIHTLFHDSGVDRDRVELLGTLPSTAEHLAAYNHIDIGLDTFPYNGATTTCEALWMGVPVITLAGRRHAGRVGVSLLRNAGFPEWIAETPEQYLALAADRARDLAGLAELRSGLRARLAASPLCDGPTFARKVEAAYREMWRKYCAS